jgi:subtilase family serine protease
MLSFRGFILGLCAIALYGQPGRVVLAGRVHRQATVANDRGAVAAGFALPGMALHLQASAAQQADLKQLTAQQQDPQSANYHRWLTPEQYADRFGAAPADVAKLRTWLEGQGFTVQNVARGRNFLTFSGTAAQVGTAFQTEIHRYSVNGEMHYANATDPAIPAEFGAIVAGISGLHDFHAKPHFKRPALTVGNGHELAPDDIATIYNIAPMYAAGIHGEAQSIIVVGQSDIRATDIAAFRSKFGLSPINLTKVLVKGSPNPGISPGDVDESHLDIE